jgi:hypothetical protein
MAFGHPRDGRGGLYRARLSKIGNTGPTLATGGLGFALPLSFAVGLTERNMPMEFYDQVQELRNTGNPFVIATIDLVGGMNE